MVLEQHLCVGDRVLSSHEDERHGPFFPRHSWRGLVVALDLDPDNAALVHDLLDEATVFADYFADERTGNLKGGMVTKFVVSVTKFPTRIFRNKRKHYKTSSTQKIVTVTVIFGYQIPDCGFHIH